MSGAPLSWKTTGAWFARAWNSFFHPPVDQRVLRLIRVGYAAALIVNLLTLLPDLEFWFAETGTLPAEIARQQRHAAAWSLLDFVATSPTSLQACFWCFLGQALLLLLGWSPRFHAVSCFVWLVSFQNRHPLIWDGEDVVLRLIGFYLIWMPWSVFHAAPIGATMSTPLVPAAPVSGWSLRLLQLQMCVIFFSTACLKLHGPSWWNGTAIYYATRLDEFGRYHFLSRWLFDSPWIVAALTWGTLVIELAAPILIWFHETRRWALGAVLLFHLGCEVSLNLFLFHWIMALGWCSFLESQDFDWLRRRLAKSM